MQFLWQGEGAVLASFFKGISGKRITESYVDLVVISNAIAMDRFNDDEGKIYSLEEEIKENTYNLTSDTLDITSPSVINIDKPIKINSRSLETNEIEDNCWDIELKDNPTPNPNPSVPQWKEVAVSTDLVTINYNLKNKNYYRVFYNGRTRDLITNIGKVTHEIKEFYYQDNENAFMLGIFNMMLTGMPMYIKNNGVSLYAEARMCNLWKLEELAILIAISIKVNKSIAIYCFRKLNKDINDLVKEIYNTLITICLNDYKDFTLKYPNKQADFRFKGSKSFIRVMGVYSNSNDRIPLKGLSRSEIKGFDLAIEWCEEANEFTQREFQAITFALGNAKKRIKIKSCNPDNIYQYYIEYMNKIVPFNLEIMKEKNEQIKSIFDNNIFKLFHYSNWKVNAHNLTLDMINDLEELKVLDPIKA
ncbi:hypothetical protein [Spiroplasma endosymbiont of Virgichneumon dumeticola]|uniref:hypothetical protein n=1 Tax=Spiroplasma endosymbiont of Virgichneumon dumeticola TaxID=3139323 RepID=UPI0035C90D2F